MSNESTPDDDRSTLEADLREAIQHRRAAQEQAEKTRAELAVLMERARWIITRKDDARLDPESPAAASDDDADEGEGGRGEG